MVIHYQVVHNQTGFFYYTKSEEKQQHIPKIYIFCNNNNQEKEIYEKSDWCQQIKINSTYFDIRKG